LGKSTKTAATRAALFDSNMHQKPPNHLSAAEGFAADLTGGAYSAPPDPVVVFSGPASKGRGEDGGSSSFAIGTKKKSRRLCIV